MLVPPGKQPEALCFPATQNMVWLYESPSDPAAAVCGKTKPVNYRPKSPIGCILYTTIGQTDAGYMLREWIQHIYVNIDICKLQCDFKIVHKNNHLKCTKKAVNSN